MANSQMELTDRALARLPFAESGQYVVRDTALPGFQVIVGKRSKTFAIYGEFWKDGVRKAVRKTIGSVGDLNTRQARSLAKETLGKVARGDLPSEAQRPPAVKPGITLQQAWCRYRDGHMVRKGRSAGTIESYRDHVERVFKSWCDKALRDLGENPGLVADRHDAITEENGPYIANGAMRTLRAVYNHARKTNRDLPENPVAAIDWNAEARRDTGMGSRELEAWFGQLAALENPIRREFHLFTLLSGSRPTALKTARLENLDLRRRVLNLPRPKGGEKKAFDIPLSRPMVRCLIRVIRYGRMLHPHEAQTWLFPAESRMGHLVEHKEDRDVLSKWGNDLRQTYRTLAQVARVADLDAHLLMNHSLPGVNAGYITRSSLMTDHLRREQERISATILQGLGERPEGPQKVILAWLCSGRAIMMDEGADGEPTRIAA